MLRIRTITALRRIHRAHAAAVDDVNDFPRADTVAKHGVVLRTLLMPECPPPHICVAAKRLRGGRIGIQQGLYLCAQRGIITTQLGQLVAACTRGKINYRIEDFQSVAALLCGVVVHIAQSRQR